MSISSRLARQNVMPIRNQNIVTSVVGSGWEYSAAPITELPRFAIATNA